MKILIPVIFLCLFATSSFAFEDTPEFLFESSESLAQTETWSQVFELINTDGVSTMLSSSRANVLLKPASTMKLFTAWWALQNTFREEVYLAEMLKKSVNAMADDTAQGLGGVLAMEDFYRDQGLSITDETFQAADGSGLSYQNKTTCQVQIELLKVIKKSKDYDRFKKLMAQPGETGTLLNRLKSLKGRLFAKTGTLKSTASLSGFLETSKGVVVFCVLSDYLRIPVAEARLKIDEVVKKHDRLASKTTLHAGY
jgi:D-alanyl-D-alanine carboxypeptidase